MSDSLLTRSDLGIFDILPWVKLGVSYTLGPCQGINDAEYEKFP